MKLSILLCVPLAMGVAAIGRHSGSMRGGQRHEMPVDKQPPLYGWLKDTKDGLPRIPKEKSRPRPLGDIGNGKCDMDDEVGGYCDDDEDCAPGCECHSCGIPSDQLPGHGGNSKSKDDGRPAFGRIDLKPRNNN